MPYGEGTYGHKIGQPKKKKKPSKRNYSDATMVMAKKEMM